MMRCGRLLPRRGFCTVSANFRLAVTRALEEPRSLAESARLFRSVVLPAGTTYASSNLHRGDAYRCSMLLGLSPSVAEIDALARNEEEPLGRAHASYLHAMLGSDESEAAAPPGGGAAEAALARMVRELAQLVPRSAQTAYTVEQPLHAEPSPLQAARTAALGELGEQLELAPGSITQFDVSTLGLVLQALGAERSSLGAALSRQLQPAVPLVPASAMPLPSADASAVEWRKFPSSPIVAGFEQILALRALAGRVPLECGEYAGFATVPYLFVPTVRLALLPEKWPAGLASWQSMALRRAGWRVLWVPANPDATRLASAVHAAAQD